MAEQKSAPTPEALVRERYTSADRLVSHGGSAGGLLVSAAANMRVYLLLKERAAPQGGLAEKGGAP